MSKENELSMYGYIKVISKRKWLIVIGTFGSILIAATVTFFLPRVYETRATLVMEGPVTPDIKIGLLKLPTGLPLNKFFLNYLPNNRDLNLEVIRKLELDKSPDELTSQALSQMVTFSLATKLKTNAINVRYSHPQKARDIANTMAEEVRELYQVLNEAEIAQSQALIDEQLNLAKAGLLEIEKDLESLRETVDVDSLKREIKSRVSQETTLTNQYLTIRMSLIEREAELTRTEKELKKQDEFYVLSESIIEDPPYKGILDKLSEEEIAFLQRVNLQRAISEGRRINPIYVALEKTVPTNRISIAGVKAKERFLRQQIEENKLALSKLRTQLAEKEPEWKILTEDYKLAKKDYEGVRKARDGGVKSLAAAKVRQLKTVGTAGVPSKPIEPNTKRILFITAVVGLLTVLFLGFFLEYMEKMRKLEADSKKQNE